MSKTADARRGVAPGGQDLAILSFSLKRIGRVRLSKEKESIATVRRNVYNSYQINILKNKNLNI